MKIRVALQIKANSELNATIDLVVGPSETIASVKEKIATAQLIPFPDQEISIDGKVLEDGAKLAASGVREGSSLTFEFKASETTLVQQLTELLKARDLSTDELGLLYCYKHGVGINQALKLLGFDGKLQDFIGMQKGLSLQNGSVALVREEAALKPFSVVDETTKMLKASSTGSMDIKDLSSKFMQKFGVSLSSIVGSRPGDFFAKEKAFVLHGKGLVSLAGAKRPAQASPALASHNSAPPGLALAPPGLASSRVETSLEIEKGEAVDAQQYMELHTKICGRPFNSKISQVLNDLTAALSEASFLDIDHVVSGGSIGKGTAISGAVVDADVVLFLRGLPPNKHESWLPPLLKAVAAVLTDGFQAAHALESIHAAEDRIHMSIRGLFPMKIDLYISPTFENYAKALGTLLGQGPDSRRFHHPSFAKERTQFVARQPSSVKVTIRLVKWWRDQQEWYGPLARPSDELLELAAIYSAIQTKPADQKVAIANLMSLLSRFDQIRIVWSNYYTKDDVWKPLLQQRPLLLDPVNPLINIADPQIFDASELIALAATTHFFW